MDINFYGIFSCIQPEYNNPTTLDEVLDMLEQDLIEGHPNNLFTLAYAIPVNPFKFSERYTSNEIEFHEATKRSRFLKELKEMIISPKSNKNSTK